MKTYDSSDRARLDGYLTKAGIAAKLGVTRQAVDKWANREGFPAPEAMYRRSQWTHPLWKVETVSDWRDSQRS